MMDLLAVQTSTAYPTLVTMVYTLLLAFVLSSMIGFTYEKTFLGLSYSRNFVQALVLSSVVASTVMQAIGDNVGRGLGMLGALSIVRFRTSFKDPRDIMFLFAALGAGIGCAVPVSAPRISLTVCSALRCLTSPRPASPWKKFSVQISRRLCLLRCERWTAVPVSTAHIRSVFAGIVLPRKFSRNSRRSRDFPTFTL